MLSAAMTEVLRFFPSRERYLISSIKSPSHETKRAKFRVYRLGTGFQTQLLTPMLIVTKKYLSNPEIYKLSTSRSGFIWMVCYYFYSLNLPLLPLRASDRPVGTHHV